MIEPISTAPPAGAGGPGPGDIVLPSPAAGPFEETLAGIRVIYGDGTLSRLGELVADLGGRHVLLVTDPGLRRVGHAARAEEALQNESLQVSIFDSVEENPTERHVAAGTEMARREGVDFLVALGGGSPMDCAKGINFLLTNGGRMEDYLGTGKARRPMLPSVGVPTTAGTGSDGQSYALIAREETREKMACGDEKARFRGVILDPALTATLPSRTIAVTGLDAVGHALESLVCTRSGRLSRHYSVEAWRHLEEALEQVLATPGDARARGRMLWGAHLAGAAIEKSMLGAAHACANPLTARLGMEHGVAVALMLPWVVRLNGSAAAKAYGELTPGESSGRAPEILAARVEALREVGSLPARLRDAGVRRDALPALAREAAGQWTAGFNPVPVGSAELLALYEEAY
jgi:alcohol dehydrogenase